MATTWRDFQLIHGVELGSEHGKCNDERDLPCDVPRPVLPNDPPDPGSLQTSNSCSVSCSTQCSTSVSSSCNAVPMVDEFYELVFNMKNQCCYMEH